MSVIEDLTRGRPLCEDDGMTNTEQLHRKTARLVERLQANTGLDNVKVVTTEWWNADGLLDKSTRCVHVSFDERTWWGGFAHLTIVETQGVDGTPRSARLASGQYRWAGETRKIKSWKDLQFAVSLLSWNKKEA